ncbi:MAG: hypothetical protein HKN62_00530 [Phycisphaerales bacterium]|nr:hypothetical protein [Phycisphaerales bacterium]
MTRSRQAWLAGSLVTIVGIASLAAVARPQQGPPPHAAPPGGAAFPDLIGAIKATPGCLGVEAAQTMSGKNVIFAWFEDKKAVKRWYYSEVHQELMDQFFPDRAGKPLAGVPDDIGPIMAVASITHASEGAFEETSLPISQIAIELYSPVTGGLFLGGRFAPETLKVDRMADYTPPASTRHAEDQ